MHKVLIAGAGPTGLTLAIELARRGVAVRVIEKSAEHFPGSRGKGLQPRTLEVFEDLGVLDEILAAGGDYPVMRAYLGDTMVKEWQQFERFPTTPTTPYPNIWMVPQCKTEQILRERLADLGVQVELGVELTGFTQDDSGVTVTLNGDAVSTVDYLIGADGGKSFVRRTLGIAFEGRTVQEERMLVGDVEVDGIDHDYWHVWPQAEHGGVITLCPMPSTRSFQCVVMNPPDGATIQGLVPGAHNVTWESWHRTNVRLAEKYRVGRVLLAGDAAHVHPPAGGQGLNTGVQDSYNLGWKLAAVLAGASADLLDTYEEERRPIAAEVLGLTTRLRAEMDSKRGEETHQLHLGYRGSRLAPQTTSGQVQAGDRAPDHPVPGGRIFDLLKGTGFTTLRFGDGGLPAEAAQAYGVRPDQLVLVRPDGYIGLIADRTEQIEGYLQMFLPAR